MSTFVRLPNETLLRSFERYLAFRELAYSTQFNYKWGVAALVDRLDRGEQLSPEDLVLFEVNKGSAKNAFRSGWKHFCEFCEHLGMAVPPPPPVVALGKADPVLGNLIFPLAPFIPLKVLAGAVWDDVRVGADGVTVNASRIAYTAPGIEVIEAFQKLAIRGFGTRTPSRYCPVFPTKRLGAKHMSPAQLQAALRTASTRDVGQIPDAFLLILREMIHYSVTEADLSEFLKILVARKEKAEPIVAGHVESNPLTENFAVPILKFIPSTIPDEVDSPVDGAGWVPAKDTANEAPTDDIVAHRPYVPEEIAERKRDIIGFLRKRDAIDLPIKTVKPS